MKALLPVLLVGALSAWATETPSPNLCGPDSTRTATLNLSTGINAAVSESALYAPGYGGNSYYTTPNTSTDAYWVISRLSTSYTLRDPAPLAYTPAYLSVGDHPYVINTSTWTPVYDHWASYTGSGSCTDAPVATATLSRWVSVYSDAGGQNPSITNAAGDPYILQRCFRVCTADSFAFSLKLMADDLVDSVWVDNTPVYSAGSGSTGTGYYCSTGIAVTKTLSLTPGRHWLRVAFRDNLGGHVGLNVLGSVTAKKGAHLVKSQYAGACSLQDDTPPNDTTSNPPAGVASAARAPLPAFAPNPNNGEFTVDVPGADGALLLVTSVDGRVVHQQRLSQGRTVVHPAGLVPGLYLVTLERDGTRVVGKMLVQ